jgi:serine/threonine protein kinase
MGRVKREIAVWRSLDHPNVTQLLGIVYLQERRPPCLVSLLRNDLLAYIGTHPESKLAIARGVAAGMEYLHSKRVVHGDIKADNILVSEYGIPQINDFDMARILDVEGFSTETCRDARFNAPELLTPGIPPTFKSDIFSLGILFLQVHDENEFPYNHIHWDGDDPQFLDLVRGGGRPIRDRYRAMSDGHWELLCYCWKGNTAERPNISQVVRAL